MLEHVIPRLTRATGDWFIDSPLESSADAYVQYLQSRSYAAASLPVTTRRSSLRDSAMATLPQF